MRVLLLGAGGMLARDLVAEAPGGIQLATRTSAELDVTDRSGVAGAIAEARPDVIVNAAAFTRVDDAERERERAFQVNGQAPGAIGRAVKRSAGPAIVVHVSTDYVFDGNAARPYREDDPTDPLGVYGASKLAGERALAASGARYLIVRTSWLFGAGGRSFPRTMWERALAGQATTVVNDQTGRPTYTVDLARALWGLLIGKRSAGRPGTDPAHGALLVGGGVLHVANTGTATWYDIARRIFEAAGVPELLSPCTTADYPTPARRPAWSVLDTTRYERLAGRSLPSWEDALDRFLAGLRAEAATR